MWRELVFILNIASVASLLGSDFFSLSPFERRAFEGVPGISGEQLYKMADGSVSDAIKLRARLSLSGSAAPVPIALAGGGATVPGKPVGGPPAQSPSYYPLYQPPSYGGPQLAYIYPGYQHSGLHPSLATLALID
ncbi:uncharacterized protein LOC111127392 [Crassostrea virginica]